MVTFSATPAQILEGAVVSSAQCVVTCGETGEPLREGAEVLVKAEHHIHSDAWSWRGVYATNAGGPVDIHPAEEWDRVLATGRLAVASDQATQTARLVLHDVEVVKSFHAERREADA